MQLIKQYLTVSIFLRIGLGFVFLYAGIAALTAPSVWSGFVPQWIETFLGINPTIVLYVHAVGDILLGFWLVSGRLHFWAGLISAVWLTSILIVSGTGFFFITFRDVGLTLAALAYAFSSTPKNKN